MAGLSVANTVRKATSGGGGGGLPGLPSYASGLPALPGMPAGGGVAGPPGAFVTQAASRGSHVMPMLTMDMIKALELSGQMIGFKDLKPMYKSPRRGLVIVHPQLAPGQAPATFALDKKLARAWGLWKPSAKPPISAGDWNSIQRANRVVKKLAKVTRQVKKVANFGSSRRSAPLRVYEQPGRKMIGRKAA